MTRRPLTLWLLAVLALLLLATGLLGSRLLAVAVPASATLGSTPGSITSSSAVTSGTQEASRGSPLGGQGTGVSAKRLVIGYYVPYDPTSWASFQAHATDLDYVDAQWVTVDGCGNVGSRDDRTLIAYANEHGVEVLPSLLTSSGWLNHRLLTDPATTDHFIKQIVSYVVDMGYPGIDLDLEGINAEDRDAYSALVATLADALHQRAKILTLALPAKTRDVRTGWAGPYDYAALGKCADLILLMTYDYSWSTSPPGSIAPQAWVDSVAAYAVSQIPSDKVLIGLAFYGYDWNTSLSGRARALQYPQAASLASQHGTRIVTDDATSSGTFSYTAAADEGPLATPPVPAVQHDIVVRTPEPCSVQAPPTLPPPTPTPGPPPKPRPTVPPSGSQQHVVWLEDATSAAARLQVAVRHNVRGVGTWRLGQEDPGVWPELSAFRSGK